MTFDELATKTAPFQDSIHRASQVIIAHMTLLDAAGTVGDWAELERCREVIKTQVDVQCDAKVAQFRLIQEWKSGGRQP